MRFVLKDKYFMPKLLQKIKSSKFFFWFTEILTSSERFSFHFLRIMGSSSKITFGLSKVHKFFYIFVYTSCHYECISNTAQLMVPLPPEKNLQTEGFLPEAELHGCCLTSVFHIHIVLLSIR